MRIYLIRHGKTPGNQLNRYIGITDEPVLEENQEQLKKQNYPKAERLFVSPLLRCRQTAACIYPGQEQQVIQNLRECDFGRFENKNWKEMTRRCRVSGVGGQQCNPALPGRGRSTGIPGQGLSGIPGRIGALRGRWNRIRCFCRPWWHYHGSAGTIRR